MPNLKVRPPLVLLMSVASAACWSASASILPAQAPQDAVAALLGADRAFAAASARTTVIPALTAMFADDVIMQAPGGMRRGKAAATEALRANAANATARLDWAPLRGGISADGQHGFTFGYMTMTPIAGSPVPLKYLAYWVKRDGTWRVAAYKRRPRPAGDVSTAMIAPAVPAQLVPASSDQAVVTGHRLGLVAAEQAFSDEAQRIGLGAAFTKFGWPDAMNMGGPNDAAFVLGNDAIGRSIGAGAPPPGSPVFWSADDAIVASSGDLGVTFGLIKSHTKEGATPPPPAPFFTIWRRIDGVWRYIAE